MHQLGDAAGSHRADMADVVKIQIARLRALLEDRDMSIDLDEDAMHWLAEAGYDPVYGARPLKRVIQRALQNPLANQILEGTIAEGDLVTVTARDGALLINGRDIDGGGIPANAAE